jgi:hypothetical protein
VLELEAGHLSSLLSGIDLFLSISKVFARLVLPIARPQTVRIVWFPIHCVVCRAFWKWHFVPTGCSSYAMEFGGVGGKDLIDLFS